MYIKITNLSEGVHSYKFDEPISELSLSEPFFGNFNVAFNLSKSHNQIILDAELNLDASFDCDRCTSNFNTKLTSRYRVVYIFGQKPGLEENSLNVVYLHGEADRIELNEDLRDFSLLAIPMKKLCKEDCKGLCFRCGKDLNKGSCACKKEQIDPRWQPLMELKNKLNTN